MTCESLIAIIYAIPAILATALVIINALRQGEPDKFEKAVNRMILAPYKEYLMTLPKRKRRKEAREIIYRFRHPNGNEDDWYL